MGKATIMSCLCLRSVEKLETLGHVGVKPRTPQFISLITRRRGNPALKEEALGDLP